MSIQDALNEATRRAQALDFSTENERIAGIDQEIGKIERATQAARGRREEVLQLIRGLTGEGNPSRRPMLDDRDGIAVADALLAGVAPTDAAATKLDRAALEHERDALSEALGELGRRSESLLRSRSEIQRAAGRRSLEELAPLCQAYLDQAKEAAERIMESFAAVSAIGRATKSNPSGFHNLAEAAAGVRGSGSLLTPGSTMPVPEHVVALANILNEKGQAYRGGVPTSVQLHDSQNAAEVAKAMRPPALDAPKMRFG